MSRQLPPEFIRDTIRLTRALSILPALFLTGAYVLDRFWGRLPQPGLWKRLVEGQQGLLILLATGPFLLLAAFSQFRPLLNQRGLLLAAPYLLLLLSIGLERLRAAWAFALVPLVGAMCVASTLSYRTMMVDPADYARFGAALESQIQPTDLVFTRKAWYTTPIYYYLQPGRYRLVGRNYAESRAQNPASRVWVVLLYDADPPKEMAAAVAHCRLLKTVNMPHAKAALYESQTFEN